MMSIDNNHLVIMAGGIGSRFWPMSTPDCPKQFIDVLGCGRTLIQLTMDRFKDICLSENIWVVTSEKYADEVRMQLPGITEDHILCEPCRRNTAPCIAYVSWKIKTRNPYANMIVTPSDHIVMNIKEFQRIIRSSLEFTANSGSILTLGITPNRPDIGYGYIEADLNLLSDSESVIYRVNSFKEKPDLRTAEEYLKKDNYYWNSGIFIWNVQTIVKAFRIYQPAISKVFENLSSYFYTEKEQVQINEQFPTCDNISVDYAIMEKAEDIYVFPANFGWSDLGTWGSLHFNSQRDIHNNVLIGQNIIMYESCNCVVHAIQEKKVVIQGLNGYIVAEKDNTLLICRLSEEQHIKEFSEK